MKNEMKNEMDLLKIGDKLYNKVHSRWSNNIIFKFGTVERLTKTQAILSDGTKLINEPKKGHFDNPKNTVGYAIYGDKWTMWYIVNEEVLTEDKVEKEKQMINSWFKKRTFTDEEAKIIYLKFKELDLLETVVTEKK